MISKKGGINYELIQVHGIKGILENHRTSRTERWDTKRTNSTYWRPSAFTTLFYKLRLKWYIDRVLILRPRMGLGHGNLYFELWVAAAFSWSCHNEVTLSAGHLVRCQRKQKTSSGQKSMKYNLVAGVILYSFKHIIAKTYCSSSHLLP